MLYIWNNLVLHRNENYRGSSSECVCISVYSGRYDQNYDCSDRGTNIEKKITAGRNIGKIKGNSGNKR